MQPQETWKSPPVATPGVSVGFGSVPLTGKREETAEGTLEPEVVPIIKDKDEAPPWIGSGRQGVRTILRPGRPPLSERGTVADAAARAHNQTVAPGGTPATGNASNDCLPGPSTVSWDVVEKDANTWRVDVTALTLSGTVNVKPWPSNPTSKTVPNTANPVDGGNIDAGNWKAAVDDMADYNTAGGGAGPDWHSTGASSAHEWAHWNTDWVSDSVRSAKGGDWSKTNAELDALTQPKATSPTSADARTALAPRVDARMRTFQNAAVTRWNAIPDTAGTAGSTGYEAGARVLAGLIASVQAYAKAKKFPGA